MHVKEILAIVGWVLLILASIAAIFLTVELLVWYFSIPDSIEY